MFGRLAKCGIHASCMFAAPRATVTLSTKMIATRYGNQYRYVPVPLWIRSVYYEPVEYRYLPVRSYCAITMSWT